MSRTYTTGSDVPPGEPLIVCAGVERSFGATRVLRGVDLTVMAGSLVALYGPSGSGKTTLLNLIGALDTPTAGKVMLAGVEVSALREGRRARLRRSKLGFIFQNYTLMPTYTALENLDLALRLAGFGFFERRRRAQHALEQVGLSAWAAHVPDELSGGQRQRVAIARALAVEPAAILADEPTSGLDTRTTKRILALFRHIAQQQGTTFVIVSHDPLVAAHVDAAYDLNDGKLTRREFAVPALAAHPLESPSSSLQGAPHEAHDSGRIDLDISGRLSGGGRRDADAGGNGTQSPAGRPGGHQQPAAGFHDPALSDDHASAGGSAHHDLDSAPGADLRAADLDPAAAPVASANGLSDHRD